VSVRALIYVRISRDREGRETGIERQGEDCRRLAKSRKWEVLTVVADNDLSASSGKRRPGWWLRPQAGS
jgi:site-specific DNA recombinase